MLDGLGKYAISTSDFPVAWRIVAVNDTKYQGFEYVRYGLVSSAVTMNH